MSNEPLLLEDPIEPLLEEQADTATIVTDVINGYDRVIPRQDVLEQMQGAYAQAIASTDQDYEERVFRRMAENLKAYEGESNENEIITIPIVKRIGNQQVGWLSTQILSKNPYITIKPLDGGFYEIPWQVTGSAPIPGTEPAMPMDMGEEMGPEEMGVGAAPPATPAPLERPVFQTRQVSSEDAAKLYEKYIHYKLTECIDFEQLVEDTAYSIHAGENPTYWKIWYDPKVTHAKKKTWQYNAAKGGLQVVGLENTEIRSRETVRIDHVPGQNIIIPLDEPNCDEQSASWLAERTPMTNMEIWEGIKSGVYDFCMPEGKKPTDDDVRTVLGMRDVPLSVMGDTMAQVDDFVASNPRTVHDVRNLWFFYPIRRTVDKRDVIEIHSLCAKFHVTARRFLNLYRNPSWTGLRPYVSFFMRKRPHRFTGSSTASDVAPIQRLISAIFDLQIKNGVQSNLKVFLIKENSATWRWFTKANNTLRPGAKIPYEDKDDVNPVQLGSTIQSMANEITYLNSEAERLTVERDYTDVPNRTAAATVSQVETLAKMQPTTVLRGVRRKIARAIEMYLQTVAQFHDYEEIPFLDEETKETVTQLIGFPREIIEHHFSFHVTATGDEDTKQARFEKFGIVGKIIDGRNAEAAKMAAAILDPQAPQAVKDFTKHLLLRAEAILGEQLHSMDVDPRKYVITEEKLNQWMAMVPPPPPPMPPGPPGAENGQQLPPAGPGGPIPQLPPGQPGPPQPPGEPSNEGMAQPGPPPNPLAGGAPEGL